MFYFHWNYTRQYPMQPLFWIPQSHASWLTFHHALGFHPECQMKQLDDISPGWKRYGFCDRSRDRGRDTTYLIDLVHCVDLAYCMYLVHCMDEVYVMDLVHRMDLAYGIYLVYQPYYQTYYKKRRIQFLDPSH